MTFLNLRAAFFNWPPSLLEREPGLARRVTAPRTVAACVFFHRPRPIAVQWVGVNRYSASNADNNTIAKAIAEPRANVAWLASFSSLRRAERRRQWKEEQPCGRFIAWRPALSKGISAFRPTPFFRSHFIIRMWNGFQLQTRVRRGAKSGFTRKNHVFWRKILIIQPLGWIMK